MRKLGDYRFKRGARMPKEIQPDRVVSELETLRDKYEGVVRPAEVVAWARRHKTSALHQCFTWDDAEAAEQYRLVQARYLLRCVVRFVDDGVAEDPVPIRVYARIIEESEEGDRPGYISMADGLKDPIYNPQIIGREVAALTACRNRLEQYGHYSRKLVEAADHVQHALDVLEEMESAGREPVAEPELVPVG